MIHVTLLLPYLNLSHCSPYNHHTGTAYCFENFQSILIPVPCSLRHTPFRNLESFSMMSCRCISGLARYSTSCLTVILCVWSRSTKRSLAGSGFDSYTKIWSRVKPIKPVNIQITKWELLSITVNQLCNKFLFPMKNCFTSLNICIPAFFFHNKEIHVNVQEV